MKISDLISILENFKNENGDLNVSILFDDQAYDLDSEQIDVSEKEEDNSKEITIKIDDVVYEDVDKDDFVSKDELDDFDNDNN